MNGFDEGRDGFSADFCLFSQCARIDEAPPALSDASSFLPVHLLYGECIRKQEIVSENEIEAGIPGLYHFYPSSIFSISFSFSSNTSSASRIGCLEVISTPAFLSTSIG